MIVTGSYLYPKVVSVLLTAGADPELYTATGCCGTALHLASAMADLTLVQSLLDRQSGALSLVQIPPDTFL